jgi:hypothetical protein
MKLRERERAREVNRKNVQEGEIKRESEREKKRAKGRKQHIPISQYVVCLDFILPRQVG